MASLDRAFRALDRVFPARVAQAHCDIPCGIYDPVTAKIGAQTVLKMVMRIQAAGGASPSASQAEREDYNNKVIRYTKVKEEHAEIVKNELKTLWADYFKPEHVQKYPDLHERFWKAEKLAGQNKQSVNLDAAKQLVAAVDDIAKIFWATKGVNDYEDKLAAVRFGS